MQNWQRVLETNKYPQSALDSSRIQSTLLSVHPSYDLSWLLNELFDSSQDSKTELDQLVFSLMKTNTLVNLSLSKCLYPESCIFMKISRSIRLSTGCSWLSATSCSEKMNIYQQSAFLLALSWGAPQCTRPSQQFKIMKCTPCIKLGSPQG